jgi:cellulose biosynthesis protein BcsQ
LAPVHVLGVCSLKGGVGKTSVVLGLASAAMARGIRTLVVDLDPQGDATTGLDVVGLPETDVADVLAGPRRRVVQQSLASSGWLPAAAGNGGPVAPGGLLDVMVGGPRTAVHDVPGLSPKALGVLATGLSRLNGYELVLLDCPPSLGGLTRTGLTASDRALVVTEPGLFAVSAADRALRAVDELRRGPAPQLQPLGVLVNRVRQRSTEHEYRVGELKALFGPLLLAPQLPERSALQQAQGAARPLHEWPSAAARELAQSFDLLLERVMRTARTRGRHRRR